MVLEGSYCIADMKRGIPLEIPKGYGVLWEFTTQAAYTYRMQLKDEESGNIYCDKSRRSTEIQPILSGLFYTESECTILVVDVSQASGIDFRFSELTITQGEVITKCYTFVAEDGCDTDYNDMLLHITAWKSLG